MANLRGLASIVSELRAERTNLVNQLRHVDAALSVLGGSSHTKSRRTLSADARRRISIAQKKRWARARNGSRTAAARTTASAPLKGTRKISAAGKRRIAAAARARWAKFRAAKKKKKAA